MGQKGGRRAAQRQNAVIGLMQASIFLSLCQTVANQRQAYRFHFSALRGWEGLTVSACSGWLSQQRHDPQGAASGITPLRFVIISVKRSRHALSHHEYVAHDQLLPAQAFVAHKAAVDSGSHDAPRNNAHLAVLLRATAPRHTFRGAVLQK